MDYSQLLTCVEEDAIPLRREIVQDDSMLAQLILEAMTLWGFDPPPAGQVVEYNERRQGNLSEFCVLDLGERHWLLYERRCCWPANKDPWAGAPSQGIDILATDGEVSILKVIEVKSSQGDGSGLVNSRNRGLKGDFERLFHGDVHTRLQIAANGLMFDLRHRQGRPDLADKVKTLYGPSPATCPGVQLVGVLVSTCAGDDGHTRRLQALRALHTWLTEDDGDQSQQWRPDQCRYYTVELHDLRKWVEELLKRVGGAA